MHTMLQHWRMPGGALRLNRKQYIQCDAGIKAACVA